MCLSSQLPATEIPDLFVQNPKLEILMIALIGFDEQTISVPARVALQQMYSSKEIV